MTVLSGARILLAVTGGIAAYKSADLTSKLVQAGARVDVILSESARNFVGAATFEALTKRPVHGSVFEPWTESSFGHVSLGHETDLLVVAPATANTIAKLANGYADDMLGAAALSTTAPLLLAPAMEHLMYNHPATQANLATLRQRGAFQVGPEAGRLASGEQGQGRMSAVETIVGAIRQVLGRTGRLAGRRIVVTAGGTREQIDPVRYIGNGSSGLMGYALAQAAIDEGARVTLISTPVALPVPYGADLIRVLSANEMKDALAPAADDADAVIMAAAVSDFRPANVAASKIKKQDGEPAPVIELLRNDDLIASINRPGLIKIGFAAETDDLIANAKKKIAAKGLSMIVANDAEATIGQTSSTAILISADGSIDELPTLPKGAVAVEVIARLTRLLCERDRVATG
jgi:phosphopantothenoylcysteine decarboxylase/phosphopantothenate--cysteine ligase